MIVFKHSSNDYDTKTVTLITNGYNEKVMKKTASKTNKGNTYCKHLLEKLNRASRYVTNTFYFSESWAL